MRFRIFFVVGENEFPVSGSDHMALNITRQLATQPDFHITLGYSKQQKTLSESKYEAIERRAIDCTYGDSEWSELDRTYDLVHLVDIADPRHVRLALNLSHKQNIPLLITPATDYELWREKEQAVAACKHASHIIALTQSESSLCQSWGISPFKITVIPPAIAINEYKHDTFRKDRGIPDHDPIVLFMGRKLPSKGYELILNGAESVWRSLPGTHFIFIGPDTSRSTNLFRKFVYERRILNLGMVEENTKAAALQTCDILCMPSVVDVFPLVFLEAWSFGKPVIASRMKGVRDVIRDGEDGLVVEHTGETVARGIVRLLTDPLLRGSMGAEGLRRVKQLHSWEEIGRRISGIHRDVLLQSDPGKGGGL